MKKIIAAISTLLLFFPFFLSAHPGHGEHGGFTITHYFTEPVHAIVTIGMIVVIAVYVRLLSRNRQQK